jgi:hypothetical protein
MQNAVAGVLQDGRATAVCGSVTGREEMALLCRKFDISRKTGFKIFYR